MGFKIVLGALPAFILGIILVIIPCVITIVRIVLVGFAFLTIAIAVTATLGHFFISDTD